MPSLCFGVGEKIVFIGDSITDCERRTQEHGPYGRGYVSLARAFLHARYPSHGLTIVNRGIGGNTIRDLAARWQEDVLAEEPDWLSVKIGINDVGRLILGLMSDHVPLDEYEATYRSLLRQTPAVANGKLILMEPYVIEPPVSDDPAAVTGISLSDVQQEFGALRGSGVRDSALLSAGWMYFRCYIDAYIEVVHRLAEEFDAILVRTQAAFDEAIEAQPPAVWAADRIHPDLPGHAVIARAFLAAVGYGHV
ncbi:MAG: SGNH/GDSL hydrolase family protein [Chloroflexota bacterium]|nr:SGNH/GDSL hydrolase family protein [Chloroflexota bacterium]MDE2839719.1 SGNH/GDSL hydrolase family protein [Chloroflexota bacterium]MDE2931033.1 SGNH/GDSL hydrolase family protein [Chloroflexota bacterium]